MAARCRRVGTKHKDHFRRATAKLERDSVQEGRVIWQCGPKFDYKPSRVREAHKPTDSMITELKKIAEELPFTTATCAQAIFIEYHRGCCRTQDGKDQDKGLGDKDGPRNQSQTGWRVGRMESVGAATSMGNARAMGVGAKGRGWYWGWGGWQRRPRSWQAYATWGWWQPLWQGPQHI